MVGWLRNYSTWPGVDVVRHVGAVGHVGAVRHVDSWGVVDSLSSVYLRWEYDFGSLIPECVFGVNVEFRGAFSG